jgi:glycosyltransferase involved in cell wall biosynthesis
MMKMLVVSRYCAYDSAVYAGSKTHNYYLKRLIQDFDVKLVTIAAPADAGKTDFDKYNINADVIYVDENPERALFFLKHNIINIPNYFGKTLGIVNGYVQKILLEKIKLLKQKGYCPDFVLLEWTQTVLLSERIRKIFPSAILVASEHDVSFLRLRRQTAAAKGLRKMAEYLRMKSLEKAELSSLKAVDLIVPHNFKDADLLKDRNLPQDRIHAIAPFYSDYGDVVYNSESSGILFFGAMDRPENYQSAAWFIENVISRLPGNMIFYIVGNRPHESLRKYRSDRIVVTGFVPDIREYLGRCFCKVAPLVSGAGIKVKVIEAMSAGLPVLANTIAIEGIPAENGTDFFHCETPDDYVSAIDKVTRNRNVLKKVSENARKLVLNNFNLDKSYTAYKNAIIRAFNKKGEGLSDYSA